MKYHRPAIACPPVVESTRLVTLALAKTQYDAIATNIAYVENLSQTVIYTEADGSIAKDEWLPREREVLDFWAEQIKTLEEAAP